MKHVCSLGDCIWAFRGTWSDRPDQGPHCAGGMTRTGWSIKVSANPVATDLMIKGTSPQEKKHIKVHRNYPWVSFLIFWGSAIELPSFAFKLNHWRSGNIGNMPPAAVPSSTAIRVSELPPAISVKLGKRWTKYWPCMAMSCVIISCGAHQKCQWPSVPCPSDLCRWVQAKASPWLWLQGASYAEGQVTVQGSWV